MKVDIELSSDPREHPDMNNLEIVVREARQGDGVDIAHLFQRYLNWITINFPPSAVFHRIFDENSFEESIVSSPVVVAEDMGQIIGFAVTRPTEPFVLDIRNVYVDDMYRDRGIGRTILKCMETAAKDTGFRVMIATSSTLWFPGKLHPTALFTRSGFQVVEVDDSLQLYHRIIPGLPHLDPSGGTNGLVEIQRFNYHR